MLYCDYSSNSFDELTFLLLLDMIWGASTFILLPLLTPPLADEPSLSPLFDMGGFALPWELPTRDAELSIVA